MSELLTNFKDDILAESMEGRRRYQMITNEDGTVSFVDVTEYEQVGSEFGQAEINVIHRAINNKLDSGEVIDPLAAEEAGFAADAKLTGDALREVSAKMDKTDTPIAFKTVEATVPAIPAGGNTNIVFNVPDDMKGYKAMAGFYVSNSVTRKLIPFQTSGLVSGNKLTLGLTNPSSTEAIKSKSKVLILYVKL